MGVSSGHEHEHLCVTLRLYVGVHIRLMCFFVAFNSHVLYSGL